MRDAIPILMDYRARCRLPQARRGGQARAGGMPRCFAARFPRPTPSDRLRGVTSVFSRRSATARVMSSGSALTGTVAKR